MTEYDIHKISELTGLAMSTIRRLHALYALGYHKNGARKLTFDRADLISIFQLSDKARLYQAAKRSGYVR